MQSQAQKTLFAKSEVPIELNQAGDIWVLRADASLSYEAIREKLNSVLDEHADELRGRNLRLDLGDRPLDLMEVRRISTLLREGFQASVIAIECTPNSIHRYTESTFKLPVIATPLDTRPRMPLGFVGAPPAECFGEEEADAVPTDLPEFDDLNPSIPAFDDARLEVEDTDIIEPEAPVPSEAGRRVMVIEKTLRSGKIIRFAGDVMVYGDVNAGSHIEADGNIIVFGSLRGLAHAGARGDERSVVMAFELRPSQIRIADLIGFTPVSISPPPPEPQGLAARLPENVVDGLSSLLNRGRSTTRTFEPEIAWIDGGEILIDSYRGRLPA